jgi:uncharacterized protein
MKSPTTKARYSVLIPRLSNKGENHIMMRLLSLLVCLFFTSTDGACQSCLIATAQKHHPTTSSLLFLGQVRRLTQQSTRASTLKHFAFHNLYQITRSKPAVAAAAAGVTVCFVPAVVRHYRRQRLSAWGFEVEEEPGALEGTEAEGPDVPAAAEDSPVSTSMISAIGFYKTFISPLLPPACRFVPTCSQYGVQAINEFGPTKGSVLIAWRLLRCSPFGGKGYDPPKWPPVSYTHGSW